VQDQQHDSCQQVCTRPACQQHQMQAQRIETAVEADKRITNTRVAAIAAAAAGCAAQQRAKTPTLRRTRCRHAPRWRTTQVCNLGMLIAALARKTGQLHACCSQLAMPFDTLLPYMLRSQRISNRVHQPDFKRQDPNASPLCTRPDHSCSWCSLWCHAQQQHSAAIQLPADKLVCLVLRSTCSCMLQQHH
jgi:hypothetical protein